MKNFFSKRVGLFVILGLLVMLGLTGYLYRKEFPVTFAEVTLQSEMLEKGDQATLTVDGEKIEAEAEDGTIVFKVYEDSLKAKKITLTMKAIEKPKTFDLTFSSRKNEIRTEKAGYLLEGDHVQKASENNVITFDSKMVTAWNNAFSGDNRYFEEILIPMWIAYAVLAVLVLSAKNCKGLFRLLVGLLCFAAFSAYIILNIPETQEKAELSNKSEKYTEILSSVTTVKQTFVPEKDTIAIGVTVATYEATPGNDVIEEIIDEETGDVVERIITPGNKLENNKIFYVYPKEKLKAGHKYAITLTCEEDLPDPVSVWYSEKDTYKDGEMYINDKKMAGDASMTLITVGPDLRNVIYISLGILFLIMLMAVLFHEASATCRIIIIYAGVLGLFLLRMVYFQETGTANAYDEVAHVSYLAYLEEEKTIIPEFENMKLLVPYETELNEKHVTYSAISKSDHVFDAKWSEDICYLGHPPLYYWILSAFHPVSIEKDHVFVDMDILRLVNIVIAVLSLLLIFYIGFTRIKKYPVLHLLYGMFCVSIPMLGVMSMGVNNDNLTILTVAIFFLGGLRFVENKRGFLTYLLLAFGMCTTLMVKMTAGVIVCVTAVLYILYHCITQKSVKAIFNLPMLASLPIYAAAGVYYVYLLMTYKSVQPSLVNLVTEEAFHRYGTIYIEPAARTLKSFWEFVQYFLHMFLGQWVNGVYSVKNANYLHPQMLVMSLMWLIPVIAVIRIRKGGDMGKFLGFFHMAILLTLVMQFIRGFNDYQFVSGHAGTQSRYYLCITLVFAFTLVKWLEKQMDQPTTPFAVVNISGTPKILDARRVWRSLIFLYLLWLSYSSFFRFLLLKSTY